MSTEIKMAAFCLCRLGIKFVFIIFCAFVIIYFANNIWEICQLQIIRPIGRRYFVIPRPGNQFLRQQKPCKTNKTKLKIE